MAGQRGGAGEDGPRRAGHQRRGASAARCGLPFPGRGPPGAAPGAPLVRPAHGPQCEWITERVGRERVVELTANPVLTGFTAPKVIWVRRTSRRPTRRSAGAAAQGLRPVPPDRRVPHGGLGRARHFLFHVRERRWAWEMLDALEIPPTGCPRRTSRPSPARRSAAKPPRRPAWRRGRRWSAGGRSAAGAVGDDRRGGDRLLYRRHVGRRLCVRRAADRRSRAPGPHLLSCSAGQVARDGRDALRGRLAALAARRGGAGGRLRGAGGGGGALEPGAESGLSCRIWRASGPARRPRRARRLRGSRCATTAARWCAGSSRGRVRAARLARPRHRPGRAAVGGPRLGRRRAQRAVAADRRVGARAAARAPGSRGRAAYGAALLGGVASGVFHARTSRKRSKPCVRPHGAVDPVPGAFEPPRLRDATGCAKAARASVLTTLCEGMAQSLGEPAVRRPL